MRRYPRENWATFGRWVADARLQTPDYRDINAWAAAVGRSTRTLRGLERGEPVGIDTIEAVARELGVADWRLLDILRDPTTAASVPTPSSAQESQERYAQEVGHPSNTFDELHHPDDADDSPELMTARAMWDDRGQLYSQAVSSRSLEPFAVGSSRMEIRFWPGPGRTVSAKEMLDLLEIAHRSADRAAESADTRQTARFALAEGDPGVDEPEVDATDAKAP